MAGVVHIVMRLLLLSFITTGVNGEGGLTFDSRTYGVTTPCEDLVCFHIWQVRTNQKNNYVAIVSNGEIQAATLEASDCTVEIKTGDVGRHHCRQKSDVFSPQNTSPELTLMPGKTVALQCILVTNGGHCTPRVLIRPFYLDKVSLTWVDGAGTEVQQDSQHQIKRRSSCDITLTVTAQRPETKTFRCQATVGQQVQTSMELQIRVPALEGKGRGFVIEEKTEDQGGNQDTIGIAVGVVGCLALTALVALFVVKRRRRSQPLDPKQCDTTSMDNDVNPSDVIYANIALPGEADRVYVPESEPTVYACVRYSLQSKQ